MEHFALICGVLTLTIVPSYFFFKYRTAGSWEQQYGWEFSKLFVGFACFGYVPKVDVAILPTYQFPFVCSVFHYFRGLFLF